MFKNSKGFTLIELLVVIFIIGLLASIVVVSVQTARAKSRDARRMADLSSTRTAIEMYIDLNGQPPGDDNTMYNELNWLDLQTLLQSYIYPLPKDPRNGSQITYRDMGTGGCIYSISTDTAKYRYKRSGTDYELNSRMEVLCDVLNTNDGGSANGWYEIGTDLHIIDP